MENESKNKAENTDSSTEKLLLSDVMNSILSDLQQRKDDSDKELNLMKFYTLPSDKYYVEQKAKSESYSEAIKIVKKYYS